MFRDGDLHLTSNRQTMFKAETTLKQPYLSRIYTPLKDIATTGFDPPYCELDTVGVVSWIGTSPHVNILNTTQHKKLYLNLN